MKCAICYLDHEPNPRRTRFRGLCRPCALFVRERSKHDARVVDHRKAAYELFVDFWHREPTLRDYSFIHPQKRRAARRRIAVWHLDYLRDRDLAERLDVNKMWVGKLRRRFRRRGQQDHLAYGSPT